MLESPKLTICHTRAILCLIGRHRPGGEQSGRIRDPYGDLAGTMEDVPGLSGYLLPGRCRARQE